MLAHGDVHQLNALQHDGGFKLIDPDGLLAEAEYELGVLMPGDPVELLGGDPVDRVRWLADRTGLDLVATWEWGIVEWLSTGLLCTRIHLQPLGRDTGGGRGRRRPDDRLKQRQFDTRTSAALVPFTPVFTNTERLALAGRLADYSGLTRQAYQLEVPVRRSGGARWLPGRAWCRRPGRPAHRCGWEPRRRPGVARSIATAMRAARNRHETAPALAWRGSKCLPYQLLISE